MLRASFLWSKFENWRKYTFTMAQQNLLVLPKKQIQCIHANEKGAHTLPPPSPAKKKTKRKTKKQHISLMRIFVNRNLGLFCRIFFFLHFPKCFM